MMSAQARACHASAMGQASRLQGARLALGIHAQNDLLNAHSQAKIMTCEYKSGLSK